MAEGVVIWQVDAKAVNVDADDNPIDGLAITYVATWPPLRWVAMEAPHLDCHGLRLPNVSYVRC